MLRLWVPIMRDSCDPGGVSDGSRLAVYQTLSIERPSSIFFWHLYALCACSYIFAVFVLLLFCFVFMLSLELCRCYLLAFEIKLRS